MPDVMPATSTGIVYQFMSIDHNHLFAHNWGTCGKECRDRDGLTPWDVNAETYINGVVLTVDHDYWMGYLIECVDRTTSVVTYLAINLYHGRRSDGYYDHDFVTYSEDCGTFFNRTEAADPIAVQTWAIIQIDRMGISYFENKRNRPCKKCSTPLKKDGLCADETCPYSDRLQHETYTEG